VDLSRPLFKAGEAGWGKEVARALPGLLSFHVIIQYILMELFPVLGYKPLVNALAT